MMPPLEMNVCVDTVEVEKVIIKRPDRISRSVWMQFWETVSAWRCPHCGKKLYEYWQWNG